jgi:predicted AAA+ superfamily ATPase
MLTRSLEPPSSSFFLFGPRSTGKTTWIRQRFPNAPTYDLLVTSESLRLNRDPGVLAKECAALPSGSWIVVDEVQKAFLVLDEVQRLMQDRGQRFVLSGSSARKLRRGGANLLGGRALLRHLFPFVSTELDDLPDLDAILRHGMLPPAVVGSKPAGFLRAYVETYLREEIQAEALVRHIGGFARFLEVAARMNGQVVNASSVARDAGVARQTVQDYLEILVDTLVASWLPAWQRRRSNKQVAHPKLYLFDPGVARHLAGLGHLPVHPQERGFLLETYLLHELRAYLHYRDLDCPVFYWRTHDGAEVDLVVETARGLVAIEVKSVDRWSGSFQRGLLRFAALHADRPVRMLGVYDGARALEHEGVRVWPWRMFVQRLWGDEVIDPRG